MYGLVNKAIEGLVVEKFGENKWIEIITIAGIEDVFVSMENYDDDITFKIVAAATKVLNLTDEQILEAFGEYWILFTAKEGYGELIYSFGDSFYEFIHRINSMHCWIQRVYPQMRPPIFSCVVESEKVTTVYYSSTRQGLGPMVVGLLRGLGKLFGIKLSVVDMGLQADGSRKFVATQCDVF